MDNILQLGYPLVPKSVTNPNVKRTDVLDLSNPMPFLTFIKIIETSFDTSTLQQYYNYYINLWNTQNNSKEFDEKTLIVDQYKNFIRDITLNYTTLEEKDFLSKVDYNNSLDLDIVLGFYSKKLKEISEYYNNKRHELKFNTNKSKLKGTNVSTEKTITDIVLSYLKNKEDGKILYDYQLIKDKLEVEIEELYNSYPYHFNQQPDDKVYDKKDLDYGENIFLRTNTDLISSIFSDLSTEMINLKELDQLFDNKRDLTKKYMAFPMYYIQTGSTTSEILSGKLFDIVNTSANFLNRNYPTTASTEKTDYLLTSREKGFFRPSNTTIVLVDGLNNSFKINYENLSPNQLYIFPDPSITGNNGNILTFTVDDSFLKRNFSSGLANNQPTSYQYDTKYYGYVSKIEPSFQKYLDQCFNMGYIKDAKRDISGNLYGLFKSDIRFEDNIHSTNTPVVTSVIFNGYTFFDYLYKEGYNFNWDTVDSTTFKETIRSGLSTNCNGFVNFIPDLILNFGSFSNNKESKSHEEEGLATKHVIYENAYIMNGNTFYIDTLPSDLYNFENSSDEFYFSDLIEAGVNDDFDPLQRALLDSLYPDLTANFLEYTNSLTAFNIHDGGRFEIPFPDQIEPFDQYFFDTTVLQPTIVETTPNFPNIEGKLMVKNTFTKQVLPLLDAAPFLINKYSNEIIEQIDNKINKFEITMDTLSIETDNWLTINRISYTNGQFTDPKTPVFQLEHSTDNFNKVSNRLKKDSDIYFCKFEVQSPITNNSFVLCPQIYRYNIISQKITQIFPVNNIDTNFFTVSSETTRYISADTPVINYDSQTNTFIISIILRNYANTPTIYNYPFYLNPDVTFEEISIIKLTPYENLNTFGTTTFNFYLSSAPYTILNEELVL